MANPGWMDEEATLLDLILANEVIFKLKIVLSRTICL